MQAMRDASGAVHEGFESASRLLRNDVGCID